MRQKAGRITAAGMTKEVSFMPVGGPIKVAPCESNARRGTAERESSKVKSPCAGSD
jgi:hypothetical protein